MQIKCENCSIVYEVAEKLLSQRHPHFFKCTSCGYVFQAPAIPDISTSSILKNDIPPVEQSDSIPMSLSEIFQPQVENTQSDDNVEVEPIPSEQKTLLKEENNEKDATFLSKEMQTPDLFSPFDVADEFMPVSVTSRIKKKSIFIILIFLIFALSAVIYLLYAGRYYFVRETKMPPTLYKNVGIETNILGEGLAFQNTQFDIMTDANDYALMVRSKVVNTSDMTKNIPSVIINLKDVQNNVVQKKEVPITHNILSAGETMPFEITLSPIAQSARKIEITFEKE